MECYNCEYLNKNDKKEGKINGCIYYCTKMKKYVNGACDSCDAWIKDYSRATYENNDIYNNGRHYSDGSSTPLSLQIILIIVLIIIAAIANLS